MGLNRTVLYILCLCFHPVFSSLVMAQSHADLQYGRVYDKVSGEVISFATIFNVTKSTGSIADEDGKFHYRLVSDIVLEISAVGYNKTRVAVPANYRDELTVSLDRQNFKLDDVNVIGVAAKGLSEGTRIDRMAMDHIQPSSFADLLELLPGNSQSDPNMDESNYISLRQAGSDQNTSLGAAFVIDGVQRSTDATMQSVYGLSYDSDKTDQGTDMRNIETDRIESVEVIDGIPSVEYGDLTSGLIIINRKKGAEPISARLKTDPNSKLFSIRNGMQLGKSAGAINFGGTYAYFTSDPRTSLSEYNRINLSANYINLLKLNDTDITLEAGIDFTQSLDSEKDDPEIMLGSEDYLKVTYRDIALSHQGTFNFADGLLRKLKYTVGFSYTSDNLKRQELIAPGVSPIPLGNEEGSKEGFYLPNEYDSFLEVDSRPLSLSTKAIANLEIPIEESTHKVKLGTEYRYDKNRGEGELYDELLPPVVASAGISLSTRPRPYNEVPTSQKFSLFAEDLFDINLGDVLWTNQLGVRATMLPGLDSRYLMSGKLYFEPRWNSKVSIPLGKDRSTLSLHFGIGKSTKMPTLSQLYPQELYYDYKQLDYYSQDPDLRSVYIYTEIEDPTNYNLTPYSNLKYEAGLQLNAGGTGLNILLFSERLDNGFMDQNQVIQHQYVDYDETSVDPSTIDSKPEPSDFTYVVDSVNATYSQVKNGKEIYKRGIQYSLSLGKFKPIATKISMGGAYYNTYYSDTLTTYYKPYRYVDDEIYSIVGLYTDKNGVTNQQFNTNFQFDTHIPSLGVMFTTSAQMTWFTKSTTDEISGKPTSYILPSGEVKPFLPGDEDDALLQYLVTEYNDYSFMTSTVPFALNINLRATKEIGDHLRFSFFVNRILDYHPDYTSKYGTTVTRSVTPSFGAELSVRL